MRLSYITAGILAATFSLNAYAADSYLTLDAIAPTAIAAPPEVRSKEWNAEIDDIIKRQQAATPEEVRKAASERKMSPEMVALAVDENFTRAKFPLSYALLDRAGASSKAITDNVKSYWNTKRPYMMDSRVKALVDPHNNPAYPSGHTSGSYVWASVLSGLMPANAALYNARANEIAQHRVMAGMHFPHDIDGGKDLAVLIMEELSKNPEYKNDFERAKEEISAISSPR